MGFGQAIQAAPTAPEIKIMMPTGGGKDIANGRFVKGIRGNFILMGGLSASNGLTGPQNAFKTLVTLDDHLTVLGHLKCYALGIYDTENSMTYARLNGMRPNYVGLHDFDFLAEKYKSDDSRFLLWQSRDILGDQWTEVIKAFVEERSKTPASKMVTLPINNSLGEPIKMIPPIGIVIDTITNWFTDASQKKVADKSKIGDGGDYLTMWMKEGLYKTQFIQQMNNFISKGNLYFSIPAHLGNFIEMNQYAPKPLTLTFSKNGTKMSGVPQKYRELLEYLGEIYSAKTLPNSSSDKSCKYPLSDADREVSNDLFHVIEVSSRNKNGASGVQRNMIISQRDGYNKPLSSFDDVKGNKRPNTIGGNDRSYYMELMPELTLSRTTVRTKAKQEWRLQNAMRLSQEIWQIYSLWNNYDDYWCDPKTLHDDLVAMGYDWDILLNTRYWWVPLEEEKDQMWNELTLMDLFMMRKGEYHPYWLEDDKVTIKKQWVPKVEPIF